jgi:hypothetical protein
VIPGSVAPVHPDAAGRAGDGRPAVTGQLEAPPLPPGHRLRPVLDTALARRGRELRADPPPVAPWPASFFGLDRVAAFAAAAADTQARVLADCARDLLVEAYFVEKLGLGFAAKMLLLADSLEERMAYGLVGGDEAAHVAAVGGHLAGRPEDAVTAAAGDPFLALLARAIAEGGRADLSFLVQVVLEGWGIEHYRALAAACLDPALGRTLAGLARDEALHHGTGLALLGPGGLSPRDLRAVEAVVVPLLELVQAGPRRVVARLAAAVGPLARHERARVFAELHTEARSGRALTLLKGLLSRDRALAGRLERRGLFRPLSAEQCAAAGIPREREDRS